MLLVMTIGRCFRKLGCQRTPPPTEIGKKNENVKQL